jgi:hypothetical protein
VETEGEVEEVGDLSRQQLSNFSTLDASIWLQQASQKKITKKQDTAVQKVLQQKILEN